MATVRAVRHSSSIPFAGRGQCDNTRKNSRINGLLLFLLGSMVLLSNVGKPRMEALHGADILGLVANGICLGVGFCRIYGPAQGSNEYHKLDGVAHASGSSPAYTPSGEFIQEYNVPTASYHASEGHTSSAYAFSRALNHSDHVAGRLMMIDLVVIRRSGCLQYRGMRMGFPRMTVNRCPFWVTVSDQKQLVLLYSIFVGWI